MNLIQILKTRNLDQKYQNFIYYYTHFRAGRLRLAPSALAGAGLSLDHKGKIMAPSCTTNWFSAFGRTQLKTIL